MVMESDAKLALKSSFNDADDGAGGFCCERDELINLLERKIVENCSIWLNFWIDL